MKSLPKVLLTNDDSHRSPLLEVLIEILQDHAALTIVVPAHEQSWRGKSITRFEPVHLGETTIAGHPATTLSGTPADCVNIGIYHLMDRRPDLIISGVNAGLNAGVSFLYSSGTVGACLEGNIARIPAVAFSQEFDAQIWQHYIDTATFTPEVRKRMQGQLRKLVPPVLETLMRVPWFAERPITWNVNFPWNLAPEPWLRVASLGATFYDSCFAREERVFRHKLSGISRDSDPRSDAMLLMAGHVVVTPLQAIGISAPHLVEGLTLEKPLSLTS